MQYDRELCKVSDNQIVYPINDTENIGDSLSSVNYNFRTLDIYTCNFEFSAINYWNNVYSIFYDNSASWNSALNTVKTNSACWNETYTTVRDLSAYWIKPISLIYPYPFDVNGGDGRSLITEITEWVNSTLPVFSGSCFNFVQGQELYVFSPMYNEINRILSQEKVTGVKYVQVLCYCACIGKGAYSYNTTGEIDCGSQRLDIQIPDRFVQEFSGLKFRVDQTSNRWVYDSALYN